MVIIIKKLVPIYKPGDDVPKKYLNLRKLSHVTSFKHLYPNITDILIREYGLRPEEKVVVYHMKEISMPHFSRYRTKFRKVYAGPLKNLGHHLNMFRNRNR